MRFTFILPILLFIIACTPQTSLPSQVTALSDIVANKEFFLNKAIAIEGTATIGWSCTEVACSPNQYNCNSCEGYFYLDQGDESVSLRIGETRICRGIEDSSGNVHDITCTLPLDEDKRYRVYGTLRKEENAVVAPGYEWTIYYLDFERAEPL